MTGFELNDDGIDMDGLHRVYRSWSMKTGFTLYICSFIVMMLIGAWLELAVPRAEGRRHHCCFCFMPSFWKCKRDNFKVYTQNKRHAFTKLNHDFETAHMNAECYEGVHAGMEQHEDRQQFMKIKDLVKEYDKGFRAVDQVNLKMYADQIFVLLGHNGAGKTSTISVLTGLYDATEGEAEVFGVDMLNDFDSVREFLGICP